MLKLSILNRFLNIWLALLYYKPKKVNKLPSSFTRNVLNILTTSLDDRPKKANKLLLSLHEMINKFHDLVYQCFLISWSKPWELWTANWFSRSANRFLYWAFSSKLYVWEGWGEFFNPNLVLTMNQFKIQKWIKYKERSIPNWTNYLYHLLPVIF